MIKKSNYIQTLSSKKGAYFGLIIVTLIIGLSFIFIKIGLKYASAMDLLAHRFTAGSIAIAILWACGFLKFSSLSWDKAKSLLLLSLLYPLSFFSFQTFGMEYSTVTQAGIIFATIPIITLIIATIFLKEKTTIFQKLGITLSVAGVVYIVINTSNYSQQASLKGTLLLIICILSMVGYYTLGRKINVKFSSLEITVWMTLLAFLTFNLWSISYHLYNNSINQFLEPLMHKEFLFTIFYLGVLSSVLTSFLTNFALSKIAASQIAVFNNLSPIITIIGGILILNEKLYNHQIIGGIFVVVGVFITQIFNSKIKHIK